MTLFGPDFLARLESLSLVSRRVFRGQLLAARRARQAGSGMEFAQHREYAPGDDFRHLDWNLFARHDELLLKRFQEETDLHVYLLLDASRSMRFGRPAKFDLARQITAALAWLALSDLDRVSVCTFGGGPRDVFPLTRGKTSILRLMDFLERQQPTAAATSLDRMAMEFTQRTRRTGMAVVISDLFDPTGWQRGLERLRHQHFEPHVVQIHTPEEADPPDSGELELTDSETGAARRVVITPSQKDAYRAAFEGFLRELRRYCSRHEMTCLIGRTDVPFDQLILQMLRGTLIAR